MKIDIRKRSSSNIDKVDFANLPFGRILSDHMLVCTYTEGAWGTAKICPFEPFSLSPATHALHYGQTIFEGTRAFKDSQGDVWLFRPEENFLRLKRSAERFDMPPVPKDVFMAGLQQLVKIDRSWVPKQKDGSMYIRPVVFSSSTHLQASSSKEFTFCIITMPSGTYYPHPLKVLVEDTYSRAAPGGVGFAKAGGNYGAQFYPTQQAIKKGYDQVIWTNSCDHKNIEESGNMNIFLRVEDRLITPPIGETILSGITRKSIIQLAQDTGITVEERLIPVEELISGLKDHSVKEFFGTGTAVVVQDFCTVGYKGTPYHLPSLREEERYSAILKQKLQDIQYNSVEDPYQWRCLV